MIFGKREHKELTFDMLNQRQLMSLKFKKHKLAIIALFFLITLYIIAIFAGFFAPYNGLSRNLKYTYCPPSKMGFSFSKGGFYSKGLIQKTDPVLLKKYYEDAPENDAPLGLFVRGEAYNLLGLFKTNIHLLGVDYSKIKNYDPVKDKGRYVWFLTGTDQLGHDIFSRIINGARVSLSVGLVGIAISFILGIILGGISGYCPGKIDTVIQRLIEIIHSFPSIPLWLALAAVVPQDWSPLQTYFAITLLLSLLSWTGLARVVRGKILSLREEDYAMAARLLGASDTRILFKHLVPGFTSHIIVSLTLVIPGMILGETSLSFLGLGLRDPVVSWGVMLRDCMDIRAVIFYPWLLTPIIFLVATVLSFNFLGDGLRDAADPYASK
jgi:peptide/nickel transport system permease protein